MNYIRHLNAFFSFVRSDNRLTSSHVSLYLALFQYWNFNRFQNPFPVYRQNMMQLSKIGSKNTYHKCLKELHATGYIMYQPSNSKFQPVKISMLQLDIHEEESKFRQLDLFASGPPYLEDDLGEGSGIKYGTDSVPDLTGAGTEIDTATVPKMGHNIKLNIKQKNSVQNTPTKIFEKNEEIQKKINMPPFKESTQRVALNEKPGVPNMRHIKPNVTLGEVECFFKQNKYSIKEAQKFFYYNQGKNWMLTEKLPITDWQSIAHKWILNSKSSNSISTPPFEKPVSDQDIQYLYDRFLDGAQISKSILIGHYDYLKLQLTEEVKQEAWQRRINQLTGSNENSENQLLEAYHTGDKNNVLVIQDEENFIALAKRVAVFDYLKKLQQEGKLNVIDKDSNK
jgi:hypothetical protein